MKTGLTSTSCALLALLALVLSVGCHTLFPRAELAYRGNGDARLLEFMRWNYMSSEDDVARQLKRHLEEGLAPGQTVDRPYLVGRGADCRDGAPVVCTFMGVANEYRTGLPKNSAHRAHQVVRVEARVVLAAPVRVDVAKTVSYPDDRQP